MKNVIAYTIMSVAILAAGCGIDGSIPSVSRASYDEPSEVLIAGEPDEDDWVIDPTSNTEIPNRIPADELPQGGAGPESDGTAGTSTFDVGETPEDDENDKGDGGEATGSIPAYTMPGGAGGNGGEGSTLDVGSGGTLDLGTGGTLDLASGGTIDLGTGGTIDLPGGAAGAGGNGGEGSTLDVGSGGTLDLGTGGTLDLASGGTIDLGTGGTIDLPGGAAGAGGNGGEGSTLDVGSGGTIDLGTGGTIDMGTGGTLDQGTGGYGGECGDNNYTLYITDDVGIVSVTCYVPGTEQQFTASCDGCCYFPQPLMSCVDESGNPRPIAETRCQLLTNRADHPVLPEVNAEGGCDLVAPNTYYYDVQGDHVSLPRGEYWDIQYNEETGQCEYVLFAYAT